MDNYIIDFTQLSNNFDFDKLIIGNKIKFENNSKYYLYYQENENEKPKDIYLKLPIFRLIYGFNTKYTNTNIPMYPKYDLIINFINFIKSLEENIISCFKHKKEYKSLITCKNNINYINIHLNDDIKITSNLDKPITYEDFKINGQIEMVIKLSYIWSNNIKYGLSACVYQIKYYGSPQQLNFDFITKQEIYSKQEIVKQEIVKQEIYSKQDIIKPAIKLLISCEDLQNKLKSLNKTNNI